MGRRLPRNLYGLVKAAGGAPMQAAQGLLAFNTIDFTLGDKPSLSANGAEDTTLHDLLAEALQELILAFILS